MQKQIRDIDRLLDIEEFADLIVKYTASINEEQFLKGEILQWGILKALENIGEAARQISEGTREEFPALGWQNMISARHFMFMNILQLSGVESGRLLSLSTSRKSK